MRNAATYASQFAANLIVEKAINRERNVALAFV